MRYLFLGFCLLATAGMIIAVSSSWAAQSPVIVINEYLADPPDGMAGDANGDGARSSSQDEFVELVNAGAAPLDVGGFTISDAAQVRFTIPAGKIIPAGEAAVIFGGGMPLGDFGNAAANGLVFSVGGAGLSLNNGEDSIIVRDSFGAEVARRDYPSSDGSANQSLTRSPDVTGDFTRHSTASGSDGRLFSPGALANGRPFVSDDPVIFSLLPSVVVAGSHIVTITVSGSRFQDGARVRVNGEAVATSFVSESELRAELPLAVTGASGVRAVTVENPDMASSNAVAFTVLGAVGINEFLADPPDALIGDANGDGARDSSDDEFIEIVNRTALPINIGGFTISDADQLRFTFPPDVVLPANEAALVFGGGVPRGEFGNASVNGLVFTAALSLNNGGDTITLSDNAGLTVERVTYGSGEGGANQSITRNPDILGAAFALDSTVAASKGSLFSPGVQIDGSPFSQGPRIIGIDPDRAPLGSEPLVIKVTGSGFDAGATLFIDAAPVTTDINNEIELTAVAPSSVTSAPGNHPLEVRNSGGNRSNIALLVIVPPPPLLLAVLPRTVQAGAGDFDIFLLGDQFDTGAVVLIDGQEAATTFLNSRELSARAPAALARSAGTRAVGVRNGDGQQSNEQSFEVALPFARLLAITPAQAAAGSNGLMLTINGANFRSGAIVFMDQAPLETARISDSELRAEVPRSLLMNPGLKSVIVQNDDGAISNDAVFRVVPVAPIVHSVEPRSVIEGSDALTIKITGERFEPGARVRIAGASGPGPALDTLFVTAGRVEARLPSEFIRTAGRLFFRVENPDFGVSNAAAFDVLIKDPIVINEFLA
ncbi:MAG TPA: lamin tail domain-containing protein, partial [Blastocatellia bacterium]|nr:lamin tail domain-containing protein [Blastocatellia bacterium]